MNQDESLAKKRGRPRKLTDLRTGEVRHTGAKKYVLKVAVDDRGEVVSVEVFVSYKSYPIEKTIQNLGPAKFNRLVDEARKDAIKKEVI